MARWQEFTASAPEFAGRVQALFTAHKHHTMATVKRDGAPRISGTEVDFESGDLRLGMMPSTLRAADLRRDPRLALHSHSVDPPAGDPGGWTGEAKLSGRGEVLHDDGVDRFRVDIEQVVLTHLEAGQLVIESWRPGRGLARRQR